MEERQRIAVLTWTVTDSTYLSDSVRDKARDEDTILDAV
jgi:hypothetical protein